MASARTDLHRPAFAPSAPPVTATAPLATLGQAASDPPWILLDLHTDHLGSVRIVTGDAGGIASRHAYLPFGEDLHTLADVNTHRFTGHERDAGTGLDYMLARYYRATTARFFSADPGQANAVLYDAASWNLYTYADSNPVRYVDPDGRFSQDEHFSITMEALHDESLAKDVMAVDWLIPGVLNHGGYLRDPATHFPSSGKINRLLDKYAKAKREGKERKARRLFAKLLHAVQDDVGHRDASGRRIGPFEHALRNIGDAIRKLFGKGCKFSPDCPNSPGYDERRQKAIEATRAVAEEARRRAGETEDDNEDSGGAKNERGLDPDGPFGPAGDPCQGKGPMCRG